MTLDEPLVRSPNIVARWEGRDFILDQFESRQSITATPLVAVLLDAFSTARTGRSVMSSFAAAGTADISRNIRELAKLGFLTAASQRNRRGNIGQAWRGSFAAAYYHFSTRDVSYVITPIGRIGAAAARFAESPQPPLFKDYPRARLTPLPVGPRSYGRMTLSRSLRQRRTIREFCDRPIELDSFATLIRGTWGQTGILDGGVFGGLLAKTSPSAGARHPIESYVITWRVRGLKPGLYHYSVRRDGLELLRPGDFRRAAVRTASGQKWIEGAAFLVILTAVADRVYWKYPSADAYRLFLLDAGHLAQTFSLLAAAAGLGSFTTAAIQESVIEKLIGLDGTTEFPLYLCGAGTPLPAARRQTGPGIGPHELRF